MARRQNLRCLTVMRGSGRFFVGGNWKANGTKDSVKALVEGLNSKPVPEDVDVIIAPIFLHLPYVIDHINSKYKVAAQNCWVERPGAHTGEVRRHSFVRSTSPPIVLDMHVAVLYLIV